MEKKWMLPVALIVVGFVGFYLFQKYKIAPSIEPEILSVVDLEGKSVSLNSYKGKKTLLCFAASWCGPCRQELKMISEVKAELLSDIEVLVISDEPVEKVQQFKNSIECPFQWLRLPQPFSSVGIHSIPTSYLINTKGEVVKKSVGFIDWEDAATARHLSKLME